MLKTKDGKEILEDGDRITFSALLMDSVQTAVAEKTVVTNDAAIGHRPGSLPMTDADMQRRHTLHSTYDAMISQRWRNPQVTANHSDAGRPTGDARLGAHGRYEERIASCLLYTSDAADE